MNTQIEHEKSRRRTTSRYEATSDPRIERDKRSSRYYFRGTVGGRFVDKSLKTTIFRMAQQRAALVEAKALGLNVGDKAKEMGMEGGKTFQDAFDLTLKIAQANSDATYDQAKNIIDGRLRPFFGVKGIHLKTFEKEYEELWAEYRLHRKQVKPGVKLGHDRRYLVMSLHTARRKGWMEKAFEKKMFTLLEATEPIGQALEDKEVEVMLATSKSYSEKVFRQVSLAVVLGLRKSEILELRPEEVDLKRGVLNLLPGRLKTRRPRKVPVPIVEDVLPIFKQLMAECQGKYLFPKWYTNEPGQPVSWNEPQEDNRHFWDQVRQDIGIDIRFHDLRHTAISNALAGGLHPVEAEQIFGATPETIRRIYAHLRQDVQDKFKSAVRGKFVELSKNRVKRGKKGG